MWEKLLIGLAIGVLDFYTQRRDLREEIRVELENGMLRIAQRALGWKVHSLESDTGTTLRVRPGSGTLVLHTGDPHPELHDS